MEKSRFDNKIDYDVDDDAEEELKLNEDLEFNNDRDEDNASSIDQNQLHLPKSIDNLTLNPVKLKNPSTMTFSNTLLSRGQTLNSKNNNNNTNNNINKNPSGKIDKSYSQLGRYESQGYMGQKMDTLREADHS